MIGVSRVLPVLTALLVAALVAVPARANSRRWTGASACAANAWIDVRCYGATGDGVTDDTNAIQNAIGDSLGKNEPLFLSAGTV